VDGGRVDEDPVDVEDDRDHPASMPMSSERGDGQTPMRAEINGAELCVDTFGDPTHPAVLLIMGAAGSMDRWEEPFCARLAAAGRYVIRYDHRDTGGSTTDPPGKPGYSSDELFADPVAILDRLGVERAHLVGLSMGGGIAQMIAIDHPDRVLSLTLMSTSPVGTGGPELPPMSDELRAVFGAQPAEPDWSDREAAIEFLLEAERPYAGSRGIDEESMRALLGRVYDRSTGLSSATNHFVLEGGETERARLAEITAPALVIHGTEDPLFALAHGEALAREIPGAELLVIDGLGHEFPPWAWDAVLPALVARTAPSRSARS
jgi:pimeloyl-ACP methyl ester carboxylesterase